MHWYLLHCRVTLPCSLVAITAHVCAKCCLLCFPPHALVPAALRSDLALWSGGHHSTCVCWVSPAEQQAGFALPVVSIAGISLVTAAAVPQVPWGVS